MTALAATNLGRLFVGIEQNEQYVRLAEGRIANSMQQKPRRSGRSGPGRDLPTEDSPDSVRLRAKAGIALPAFQLVVVQRP